MLIKILVSLLFGSIMGIATHAKRNKLIKLPRINKTSLNPGFLLDSFFGAMASLIAVMVASPADIEKVIVIAILAGYTGENFVRKMADRNIEENIKKDQELLSELDNDINENVEDKDK